MFKTNYTTIPTNGLVLDLPLNGNTNARVGSNGSPVNIIWVPSERGYTSECASLNGSSSYVNTNISNFSTLTSVTFNIWFKLNSNLINTFLIGNDLALRMFVTSGGKLRCDTRSSTGVFNFIQGAETLIIGKKYMATVTFQTNGFMQLFLNGVLVGNVSVGNKENADIYGVYIGVNNRSGLSGFFNGQIGLAKIYNRALSQQEITNLYQEGLRELGPSQAITSNGFKAYSTSRLESGKILEISRPKIGSNYINQVNGNTLAITGTITETTEGLYNKINLTGSQYINCGDIIDETKGTIILNYIPTRIYNFNSIFDNLVDANKREMWIDSGANLRARTSNGISPYTDNSITKTGITVNKNYRIAYTWNTVNNQTKLYIDGVLVGTNNHQTPPATNIYFGGGNIGNTKGEGGLINISLYNRTLSDEEILEDYYSTFIPN